MLLSRNTVNAVASGKYSLCSLCSVVLTQKKNRYTGPTTCAAPYLCVVSNSYVRFRLLRCMVSHLTIISATCTTVLPVLDVTLSSARRCFCNIIKVHCMVSPCSNSRMFHSINDLICCIYFSLSISCISSTHSLTSSSEQKPRRRPGPAKISHLSSHSLYVSSRAPTMKRQYCD